MQLEPVLFELPFIIVAYPIGAAGSFISSLLSLIRSHSESPVPITNCGSAHQSLESLIDNTRFGFKETARECFFNPNGKESSVDRFKESLQSQVPRDVGQLDISTLQLMLLSHRISNTSVYQQTFPNSKILAITCDTDAENHIAHINAYRKHRFNYDEINRYWWMPERAKNEMTAIASKYMSPDKVTKFITYIFDNKIDEQCMDALIWMKFNKFDDLLPHATQYDIKNADPITILRYKDIIHNDLPAILDAFVSVLARGLTVFEISYIATNLAKYHQASTTKLTNNVPEYVSDLSASFNTIYNKL